MKLEIKKIRVKELKDFVESDFFRNLENVPISPARAKSYIHNPHAKPDDLALVLGFIQNNLVAFRSLFAGLIETETQKIRFGWCSGNWVHPEFRRKGFSFELLKVAFSDWNGKLMFTNYAPESERLYLKTGWFFPLYQFRGIRAYLFPKTRKLLPLVRKNSWMRPFFWEVDVVLFWIAKIRTFFFNEKKNPDVGFELLAEPDEQCYQYLNNSNLKFVFGRKTVELKWIFQFPWISEENNNIKEKYQFSANAESFYYQTVKVFYKDKFSGFFIFSVKDLHLKTLYISVQSGLEDEIAGFLKKYCINGNIEMATIYNSAVADRIYERKFPFLHAKKYGQKIYCSFEVKGVEGFQFQDGDGDVIFT